MTRLKLILIILTLTGSSFFIIRHQARKIKSLKREKEQVAGVLVQKEQDLVYVQNKLGEEVAKTRAKDIRIKDLDNIVNDLKDVNLQWITKFNDLRQDLKNLESATKLNTQTIMSFESKLGDTVVVEIGGSELKARPFRYEEPPYFYQEGLVLPDRVVVDSMMVEVPLQGVVYWERKKKFLFVRYGRKSYISQFSSPNPYTRITGLEHIKVEKK